MNVLEVERLIYLQYNKKVENGEKPYRLINTSGNSRKLFCDDIICISKIKGTKYVQYTTKEGECKEQVSLEQLEQELDRCEFVLVARGIIVNMCHVVRLQGNKIYLDNQMQVEISRTKSVEVKEKIRRYWERQ
ncbi:LytTR family transcriptional regulator DNA-binding domain-containing protein [Bariatricus sp. SGI.154]|uniref:LytTR family transcriptional regulator DNA-binding domain-containing protein n=1 Tax=Bariatricus sp. SGI.154 TaxID=3420549 RepID=UPI003D026BDF